MCEKLPCVCDICNCGRHRCPHKLRCPGHWDKCILSEYNTRYVPHDVCPSKSFKPGLTNLLGDGPLSKETTHRVDYIPRCGEPPWKYQHPEYIKPEGNIDDVTMYRKEYGPKELCPRVSLRAPPTRTVPAKFEGETTNRSDYRPWDMPPRVIHNPENYCPNEHKFDGIPSYQRDYIPHCIGPPDSFKPKASFLQSTEPMSQDTDYRQSYVNHPLDRRAQKKAPCYFPTRAPLESLTTHKKEYTKKEICPPKNFKPPAHFIQADKPLSDETTHRVDYRLHDIDKPYKYDPGKYVKPEGEMDLKTTYNKDYTNLLSCPNRPFKPLETRRVSAPFVGETSYRENYKKWDVLPVKPIHKDCFVPTTDPFDDCTTFKSAYVPHEICRVKSFKPEPHMMSEEPFDDSTNYRTEYTKKAQPCCPAAFLTTDSRAMSPDGYMYHCEDAKGHLHYRRGKMLGNRQYDPDSNDNNRQPTLQSDPIKPSILKPLAA